MVRGDKVKRVVVVGQGYVGLPMALRAAEVGHSVTGLDTNTATVAALNAGRSHIDDVSNQQLNEGLLNGYSAATDTSCIKDADVVVVCVPTPLNTEGGPDLQAIETVATTIGHNLGPGTLVILESTTYPGTTEEIFAPLVINGKLTVGEDVYIAFSPERIDPGNEHYKVKNTPKVVGGLTPRCTRAASEFYATFIDEVVEAKGAREAEMAKLLENTFRHVNIALMNEILRFCDELEIDLWNAITCAETKPFGFMAFRPGPGVGGHCIPVDPSYLSYRVRAKLGYAFRMVELAEEINKTAPFYVADRVWKMLNQQKIAVNGANVLLVGVTYKANVSDCRESPAAPLAERLASWGAIVTYHDPRVPVWQIEDTGTAIQLETVANVYETAANSDIVVLLQPHSEYDLDRLASVSVLMLDTRGTVNETDTVFRL